MGKFRDINIKLLFCINLTTHKMMTYIFNSCNYHISKVHFNWLLYLQNISVNHSDKWIVMKSGLKPEDYEYVGLGVLYIKNIIFCLGLLTEIRL